MTGKQLKKKHPELAKRFKIKDKDDVYLDMEKIKILRHWDLKVIKTGIEVSLA